MNKIYIILCLFCFSVCYSFAENAEEHIVGDLVFSDSTIKCESIRFINTCKLLKLLNNHSFIIIKLTNVDSLNNNDKDLFVITLYDHMHLRPWDNLLGYVIYDGYPIAVIGDVASSYFEKNCCKENAVIEYKNANDYKWETHLYTRWYHIKNNTLCLINYFPKNISKEKNFGTSQYFKYNSVKYVEENSSAIYWKTSIIDDEVSCDSDFFMLPIAIRTNNKDIIINPNELPILSIGDGLICDFYKEISGLYNFSSDLFIGDTISNCISNSYGNVCDMENDVIFSITMDNDGVLVLPDGSSIYVKTMHTQVEFPILVKFKSPTDETFCSFTGIMIYDCLSWITPDNNYPIMESIIKKVVDKDHRTTIKEIFQKTVLYSL